jgi:hypothetical protein
LTVIFFGLRLSLRQVDRQDAVIEFRGNLLLVEVLADRKGPVEIADTAQGRSLVGEK